MKKKLLLIALLFIGTITFTGCNKQIFDFNYTFDKAICNIGGEYKTIEIQKWTDYDGEQIQIIAEDDTVYLVSSINCTLIDE